MIRFAACVLTAVLQLAQSGAGLAFRAGDSSSHCAQAKASCCTAGGVCPMKAHRSAAGCRIESCSDHSYSAMIVTFRPAVLAVQPAARAPQSAQVASEVIVSSPRDGFDRRPDQPPRSS